MFGLICAHLWPRCKATSQPSCGATAPSGAKPDRVAIRVSDTGRGIPDSELPNIFDRYYHVDRGEMSDIGRTGLGLAITRHVVELHGGTISVESVLGKGTTFSFDLPVDA